MVPPRVHTGVPIKISYTAKLAQCEFQVCTNSTAMLQNGFTDNTAMHFKSIRFKLFGRKMKCCSVICVKTRLSVTLLR